MKSSNSATTGYDAWSATEYLRQFYTTATLATDDVELLTRLAKWLRGTAPVQRALEVGCGPVIHHAALVTPYADEIHLADFLPDNLDQIRLWRDNLPGQHNWSALFRHTLELEGASADPGERATGLRRKITQLLHCDLTEPHPLGAPASYDLVTSFFCGECVRSEVAEWEQVVANLAGLVAPGGRLFIAAVRNASFYHVFDRTFPAACVNETHWSALLPKLGFDPAQTTVEAVSIPDWVDQGFDSICVIAAAKS